MVEQRGQEEGQKDAERVQETVKPWGRGQKGERSKKGWCGRGVVFQELCDESSSSSHVEKGRAGNQLGHRTELLSPGMK